MGTSGSAMVRKKWVKKIRDHTWFHFSWNRGLACDIFLIDGHVFDTKKCKPNNPSGWWNLYLWDKKHAFTRVSFKYNRGDCSWRDSRWNPRGAGKRSTFMGVWNKTSQYDWTNEFYLSEYFGTSHSRSFQATRVQFFLLNRGSLMWALWWSVEYGW